jgi:hypothetical protein
VHVCIVCRLAGNSQVSIAKSTQHARNIVMRVRISPGHENQVCLCASDTGRIGREWLSMFFLVVHVCIVCRLAGNS